MGPQAAPQKGDGMRSHKTSGNALPTGSLPVPSLPGGAVADGLVVCARAVGADGALLEDLNTQKFVALWAGSATAVGCSCDVHHVSAVHGGQGPAAVPASFFPIDILEAFGFVPVAAWSSDALAMEQRRHRLTLVWRQAPPGSLNVVETTAVMRALLAADRDRESVDALRARLLAVSRVAILGKVAAAAGHDFNNLLGRIIGSAELVLDRVTGDAEACEELERLMSTAEQGAGVVRRLSVLAGLPIAEPEPFDVSRLLQDHASQQAGLRMAEDCSPVVVYADPIVVSAMITAVIQDARERGATRIDLSAAHLPGQSEAEVAIRDDGQAPEPTPLLPLSDHFFTAGPILTSGVGHEFLRAAVAETLGRLEISSTSRMGATVRLILPRPVTDPSPQPAPGPDTAL